MFDETLIALQQEYARDLLSHYNPYTKLRYCDDPAICLVEIINESSLFEMGKNVPEYYSKQLDKSFSKWLTFYSSVHGEEPSRNKDEKIYEVFLFELEQTYFNSMIKFLKQQVRVKVPIGIGGHWNPSSLKAQIACLDYVDRHTYWDHPKYLSPWSLRKFKIKNNSALLDHNLGVIKALKELVALKIDKPLTITEWNHCYPNKFAYETPLLLAVFAQTYDFDALFQFAFTHHTEKMNEIITKVPNHFDIIGNAQQLQLCSFASLIFNNSKECDWTVSNGILTIDTDVLKAKVGFLKGLNKNENGAIISFNNQIITIGEIKNSSGRWINEEEYQWGKAPSKTKKAITSTPF